MEIKSLAGAGSDTVFDAFSRAFADYEMQLDKRQLEAMLKRRGFDPALSFAAYEDGKIVSFTFNGIGDFHGIPTAYDTGTGTLGEYRGQGLATAIFEHSIPYLREYGVKQYLLEVLRHNTGAVSVYRKLGFQPVREFNYFTQENDKVNKNIKVPGAPFFVRAVDIPDYGSVQEFWDFRPSWQNSFESVGRSPGGFVCLGALVGEELAGYCIFEPSSGDITQIAVDREYRRKGIASRLIGEMLRLNKHHSVKAVNAEINCLSVTGLMKAMNINLAGQQFEMIKEI